MRNTKNSIRNLIISVFLLAAVVITGCGGSVTPEPTEAPATSEPTQAPDGSPVGRIRLPMPENMADAEDCDPIGVRTEEMYQLFSLVFDTLIGVNGSNMLVPSLAMSWRSGGERIWLISLRQGVTWHDGSSFTADDVVSTYDRIRRQTDGYYSDAAENIVSLMKLDESTIRVEMKSEGLSALYCLNFPITKANSDEVLMGTGAYRLESMTDEEIKLTVNTDWWGGTPQIETVEFLARGSNDLAIASYEAGMLDFVPTNSLTAKQYSSAGETVVASCMTQQMETLLINHNNAHLRKREFRSAIAHLVDRSSIIANVYMNNARSCDMPVPPDSWLYDSSQVVYGYDRELALSLLTDQGYTIDEDGNIGYFGEKVSLRILVGSTPENSVRAEAAQLIADSLTSFGIGVELITANHDTASASPDPESEAPYSGDTEFVRLLREGNWDLALVGFSLSESNSLSKYLTPSGSNNFGHYSSETMTSLIEIMDSAVDEASLREAAYAVQSEFAEELPFIVLYFRLNSVIYSADIQGIGQLREPRLLENMKDWRY
ncbi:MAG: ABC transporter substrate-binding protein [Eubacteriales bacterium]|nr:ABC transporter substrate-binding protein [Eubacteriales bacterium]